MKVMEVYKSLTCLAALRDSSCHLWAVLLAHPSGHIVCCSEHASGVQVGCWDGTAAIFQMQPDAASDAPANANGPQGDDATTAQQQPTMWGMRALCHFLADPTPVRALAWLPPQVDEHFCLSTCVLSLLIHAPAVAWLWSFCDTCTTERRALSHIMAAYSQHEWHLQLPKGANLGCRKLVLQSCRM